MRYTIKIIAILALPVCTFGTSSAAECATTVECAQDAVEAATTAVAAVRVLLPKGAVVPFNLNECPAGWERLVDADGRFIVASSDTIQFGSEGGTDIIPSQGNHNHNRVQISGAGFGDDRDDNQYRTDDKGSHNHGGNNMPPYLALTMCEKL